MVADFWGRQKKRKKERKKGQDLNKEEHKVPRKSGKEWGDNKDLHEARLIQSKWNYYKRWGGGSIMTGSERENAIHKGQNRKVPTQNPMTQCRFDVEAVKALQVDFPLCLWPDRIAYVYSSYRQYVNISLLLLLCRDIIKPLQSRNSSVFSNCFVLGFSRRLTCCVPSLVKWSLISLFIQPSMYAARLN